MSTIHANGATEVLERLKNLDVDDFSIKSNLRLSVAQRLVQKICPFCSPKTNPKLVNKAMRVSGLKENAICDLSNFRTIQPEGCEKCKQGVIGRVIVMEYLNKNDIESLIDQPHAECEGSPTPPISLKKECFKLASQGIVDIQDVFQIS